MSRPQDVPLQLAVVRLGQLGDLVMLEPALSWLATIDGLRVRLVTDPHYVPLFRRLVESRGIVVHHELGEPDLVLDLHGVARSRRLRRGHPWLAVNKEDLRRRLRVHARWTRVPTRRTWPERHIRAARRAVLRLGLDAGPLASLPAVPSFAPLRTRQPGLVGFCPGAGWANKRWPLQRWQQLARSLPGDVVAFGSSAEQSLIEEIGVPCWPDTSLIGLAEGLSGCDFVVAGDTGPLHLAGALGCRVVGLFGPTPTDTGFWVWAEQGGRLKSSGLSCSPCSLHGGDTCPRGHHRCMTSIEASSVLECLPCG